MPGRGRAEAELFQRARIPVDRPTREAAQRAHRLHIHGQQPRSPADEAQLPPTHYQELVRIHNTYYPAHSLDEDVSPRRDIA